MARYENITQVIGNTPLVRLNHLTRGLGAQVWVKMESQNPASSVKDRIGLAIIEAAERAGTLKPGGTIVEATSGNTGIALAWIGGVKGYKVVLVMPDSFSMERRRLLKTFGAELVLTPGADGMPGAIARANEIVETTKGAIMARQFDNEANPLAHYTTTAEEIWAETEGAIDIFLAGVGSGGTITGVGRRLRELKPSIRIIALEPDTSPVLSGGQRGPNRIQGIGAGFIPAILDTSVYSEVMTVSAADAGATSRALAKQEGILAGISAGANVWAALQLAKLPANQGKTIVTVICDTGERYLSTWLFED